MGVRQVLMSLRKLGRPRVLGPSLPGTEGFPRTWDLLKPGKSQAHWDELANLSGV